MTTTGIGGINSPGTLLSTSSTKFGDNPFLALLTTQLRNQTPFEPVDNDSFMQQLATFSSMQEQKELNQNMLALLDYQGILARLQGLSEGSALLGKEVTYSTENGDKTGIVDSVYVSEQGEVRMKVDGEDVSMGSLIAISQPSSN